MTSAMRLVSFSLLLCCAPFLSATGQGNDLESVPDLEKAMYLTIEGYPCVRLLNLSSKIGCSNPGREKVIAPIVRLKDVGDYLFRPSAVLVPVDEMQNFFLRVLRNQTFGQNVAGVLVESMPGVYPEASGFSPANKFPLAEFAPYQNQNYEWNPDGSGIMWNHYDFPVFLLPRNSTLKVQEIADRNEKNKDNHLAFVAEFDLVMQTTKLETHDSESCLKAQTCLPLGGYSVWSSLPPIDTTAPTSPKPLILAVSSMDSASFFRDLSVGADSPISGLISLLAAVDALSHTSGLHDFKKRLVFLVFTGEAWGYLGSRKFLAELELGSDTVKGLNITLIEQVLEIGSVGKLLSGETTTVFAHSEEGSSVKELMSALERASDSLASMGIKVKKANSLNPGIPPSSLMTFLRKNSSTNGVVLEEFDSVFTNKFYESHLDNNANINSSSLVAAASLVARTLYILAKDNLETSLSELNSIEVNETLVKELAGCLLSCEPGLSCGLVKSFISARSTCPNHYVGVFLGSPSGSQNPEYVDDTSRFIWNFLADRTSVQKDNISACSGKCENADEVCVGSTAQRKGRCLASSTSYVPAYSTRLTYESGLWHVLPANSSDLLGMVDPVWTESFWNFIGLRVYNTQSSAYDTSVLVAGIAITVSAYAAIICTRSFFMKAVKHD